MKKFCFFVKNDPSQECITTQSFRNKKEALQSFASVKNLPVPAFSQIYDLKEVSHEGTNTSQT